MRPLGERFEVIDRFAGLDFDDGLKPAAALEGQTRPGPDKAAEARCRPERSAQLRD